MISTFPKLCCFLALLSLAPTCWAQSFPSSYDGQIASSAAAYLYPYDWRYWKAQCYQESRLNPLAISPAGAMGLCQIMPRTWGEQSALMGVNASPFNPNANALVGAAYMRRMLRIWTAERPAYERLRLAWASYNAGAGNIIKAQKICGGRDWQNIAPCLHDVTGFNNSHETITYVARIPVWYQGLVAQP